MRDMSRTRCTSADSTWLLWTYRLSYEGRSELGDGTLNKKVREAQAARAVTNALKRDEVAQFNYILVVGGLRFCQLMQSGGKEEEEQMAVNVRARGQCERLGSFISSDAY